VIGSRRIEDHDEHHSGDLEKNNIEKKRKNIATSIVEKTKNYNEHHGENLGLGKKNRK
jgi:hypothetical protein